MNKEQREEVEQYVNGMKEYILEKLEMFIEEKAMRYQLVINAMSSDELKAEARKVYEHAEKEFRKLNAPDTTIK